MAALRSAGCVFAEDEARLLISAAPDAEELAGAVRRRAAGEPLEQLLGWAEFAGLRILVEPGVFVPRRRTELMVREALRELRTLPGRPVVVDLCCGSGAVGAALAARRTGLRLYATDVDPAAVHCARRNLAEVAEVFPGDLFAPLPVRLRGAVDVVVANAPYVPSAAIGLMPPEARDHEPRSALDGGSDGLDVHRRVIAEAPGWLAPGGRLLIEVADAQVEPALDLFASADLTPRVVRSAALDARVVIGRHGRRARAGPTG